VLCVYKGGFSVTWSFTGIKSCEARFSFDYIWFEHVFVVFVVLFLVSVDVDQCLTVSCPVVFTIV